MTSQSPSSTSPISIKLTESAVFLRSPETSGNHRHPSRAEAPGLLRGLLELNFEKPVKVSEIVVKLTCKCSATWQEGVGLGRIDVTEEGTVFKAEQVFFKASHNDRRRASLPPAIVPRPRIQDLFVDLHDQVPSYTSITPDERPRQLRRLSADLTNFQHDAVEQSEARYSPPSTPLTVVNSSDSQDLNELGRDQRSSNTSSGLSTLSFGSTTPPQESSIERRIADNVHWQASGPISHRHPFSSSFTRHSPESSFAHQSILSLTVPRQRSRERELGHQPNTGFSLGALSHSILDKIHPLSHRHSDDSSQLKDHSPDRGRSRTHVRADQLKQKDTTGVMMVETIERYLNKGHEAAVWKEFKPGMFPDSVVHPCLLTEPSGVHTYAISIPIPADLPTSVECPYGKVSWKLKATVHRPGAFTPKYQHSVNITVAHNLTNDGDEEMNSVTVERQWDQQLQYLFSLSGQHFYIGGTLSFSLTLFPLDKVKIHKLTVFIEERIDYLTKMQPIVPIDPRIHIVLLSAKSNDGKPILPIESDDPDAFIKSPLHQFLSEHDDISEMTSTLMGPGPWTLRKNLELPSSCSLLHWTHLNRKSLILISHVLKCIIRVERGDDHEMDKKTGKRKLYDIVIQTGIEIGSVRSTHRLVSPLIMIVLECYCNPNWAGLPPYSTTSQDTKTFDDKCPCETFGKRHGFTRHIVSRHSTDPETPTAETSGLEATMLSLRGSDAFYRNNVQYERLISGQEEESGEVPPPYPPA
ncbi:hypothetical protein DL96DRAFT_1820085 [Flagelloscypha sp. PMI_526]|nr:hypothetical protein DL96DRAFT_1820085 [Flagelloscypha sp. PMI_526]